MVKKKERWNLRKYRAGKNIFSVLELLFGLYFVATIGLAMFVGAWWSIPFLVLFMVGFLYVGGLSLYHAR